MTTAAVEQEAVPGDDQDGSRATPPSRARRIVGWVITIGLAMVVSVIVRTFVVQVFWIPSESMENTLVKDDRVMIEKVSDPHHPTRGDVIVFRKPPTLPDAGVEDLIKRVIALPGESVVIDANHIFIDGRQMVEPYLDDDTITRNRPGWTQCTTHTPCVVPDGHVWVMGDNRENSEDSRSPRVGPIDENDILGRAFVRWWPLKRFSGL